MKTIRERLKSALYLRLKKIEGPFGDKEKFREKVAEKKPKGWTFYTHPVL